MTPGPLLQALCEYASEKDLSNINLVHIHLMGDAPFVNQEKYRKHFRDNSLFIGANVRKHVYTGDADFTPMFLSEIPRLFEDPDYRIDHAFVSVSPPDKHGYVSFMPSIFRMRSVTLVMLYSLPFYIYSVSWELQ